MSLEDFLRSRPPAGHAPGRWTVESRAPSSGSWAHAAQGVDATSTRHKALTEGAASPAGTLVRLSEPGGDTRGFWVAVGDGRPPADLGPVPRELGPYGWDWATAWEGTRRKAEPLLWAARAADRHRLALVACDAVEPCLALVPDEEARPREAVAAARAWALGTATVGDATRAARLAGEAALGLRGRAAEAAMAAALAASVPTGPAGQPLEAVKAALAASRGRSAMARTWALAAVVRRWLPLPVAALARAGEPTPLSLGF